MHIHYLQHVPFEGLASIESWALARGHRLSATRFFAHEPLPSSWDFDGLIVMGGPMNIYETEKYFWLTEEKQFIEHAMESGKTVVGICLGAQLIADVLGAKVTRNVYPEIGWFPVEVTERSPIFHNIPEQFHALHWHGDTFALPQGAVPLARSEACENQAFVYAEKVLSLQFHLEATPSSVRQLISNCGGEITDGKYMQQPEMILQQNDFFAQGNQLMWRILDNLTVAAGR